LKPVPPIKKCIAISHNAGASPVSSIVKMMKGVALKYYRGTGTEPEVARPILDHTQPGDEHYPCSPLSQYYKNLLCEATHYQ